MPAPIEAKPRRSATNANTAGISSAVMPIEVRHSAQPRQKLAFQSSFPPIHGYRNRAAIKYLSAGIGIAKEYIATPGDYLSSANGSGNQEGEGDRADPTQRTLLSTKELRMPPGYFPDANQNLDLHGRS